MGLRGLVAGVRALWDRGRVDVELDEELLGFVAESEREKLRRGMSVGAARRAARVEMGSMGVVKHKVWGSRWEATVDGLMQDFKLGVRGLMKSPGFMMVAVVSLALGIGANTAIFTLIHQVLMRELAVEKPQELVTFGRSLGGGILGGIDLGTHDMVTYDFAKQLEADPGPFAGVAAFSSFAPRVSARVGDGLTAQGASSAATQTAASLVSGNYFSVIGAHALMGRTIVPADAAAKGQSTVVVVSYRYWQEQLSGDASALGRTVTLNGTAFRVIGVMPASFIGIVQGVGLPELWVPVTMQQVLMPGADMLPPRSFYFLHMFARMKAVGDLKQDQAWLDGQVRSYIRAGEGGVVAADRQKEIERATMKLIPGAQGVNALEANFGDSLQILMVVVGLVLLIACANLANFLLARAAMRERETATRLALGSSRMRILRQSLMEAMLLSLTGGALGLAVAFAATRALIGFVAQGSDGDGRWMRVPDGAVLLFTLGVSLVTGLLFGLGPALTSAWGLNRTGAATALSANARSTTGGKAARLWPRMLVIAQVTLSLLLLVGSGLFLKTLDNLQKQDYGFERTRLLLARFDANQLGYKPAQAPGLNRALLERIGAVPGVESASLSATAPISGGAWVSSLHVEGYTPKPKEDMSSPLNRVSGKYFETNGIRMVAGRAIGEQDTATSLKVVVINETMARYFFPKGDAVGGVLKVDIDTVAGPWRIVGIARDTLVSGPRAKERPRMVYFPLTQVGGDDAFVNTIEVRTVGDPAKVEADLRRAVMQVDPNLALTDVQTITEQVDAMMTREELIGSLTAIFAMLAVGLAAIGLYGVMSYAVVRRTGEIGIRLALGAQTRGVLWMVLRESLVLLGVGLLLGLPLTLALTRVIRGQLFGLSATDPATFAMAIGVVGLMTLLAAWLPARRASRVDPMVALRCE